MLAHKTSLLMSTYSIMAVTENYPISPVYTDEQTRILILALFIYLVLYDMFFKLFLQLNALQIYTDREIKCVQFCLKPYQLSFVCEGERFRL